MAWLVDASSWRLQLQRRLQVIEMLLAAQETADVTAFAVESACAVVYDARMWLSEAEAWQTRVELRQRGVPTM